MYAVVSILEIMVHNYKPVFAVKMVTFFPSAHASRICFKISRRSVNSDIPTSDVKEQISCATFEVFRNFWCWERVALTCSLAILVI